MAVTGSAVACSLDKLDPLLAASGRNRIVNRARSLSQILQEVRSGLHSDLWTNSSTSNRPSLYCILLRFYFKLCHASD